jgi:hypothetical protein
MLLPENPEKKLGLWDAVTTQLAETAMCFIIKDGIGNPLAEAKGPNRDEAELVLARLRGAQICRISANRSSAFSPHFAGKREGNTVLVTELLTSPSEAALTVDNEKLKRDLETAVINLLFTESGVNTVLVPLPIAPWAMRDAEISLVQEALMFSKRS